MDSFIKNIILVIILIPFYSYAQTFNWDFAKSFGGPGPVGSYGITTDKENNIYVFGAFLDSLYIGDTVFKCYQSHTYSYDGYIAKFTDEGEFVLGIHIVTTGLGILQKLQCVVDNNLNIIVSGVFLWGTLKIQGKPIKCFGSQDSFICKYDQNGNVLWIKHIKGTGPDEIHLMKMSDNNNFYIATYHNTSSQFSNNYVIYGNYDTVLYKQKNYLVLAMYDNNGELIWLRSGNTLHHQLQLYSWDMEILGEYVYLVGPSRDTLIFDQDTLPGQWWPFRDVNRVIKYNERGKKSFIGSFANYPIYDAAIDTDDNYYTTGHIPDTLIIGNDTITQYDISDICLAKYDAELNLLWYDIIPTNQGFAGVAHVITRDDGYIYASGHFKDEIQIGDTTIFGGLFHRKKFFIAKYTKNGEFVEVISSNGKHQNSGTNEFSGTDILIYDCQNILVSGGFTYRAYFGNDTLQSLGSHDIFFAKLGTDQLIVSTDSRLSLKEPSLSLINITPNPTPSEIIIEFNDIIESAIIQLHDLSGKILQSYSYNAREGHLKSIDLGNYPKGVYLFNVQSKNFNETKKIIKL
ncbi:MAG: T9SS type A sorting domain-containing protein [Bacteroidales bacterium]|nr:T9SS type A sorting domain-containing protein [Bacteroidales bacterium]